MLAHCYERALLSQACDKLVIATPDEEIMSWANNHEIPAVLTSHHHERATERAQETLNILSKQGERYDFILLLQGDEPQIFPDDIKNLSAAFSGSELEIVNLVYPIDGDDLYNPNVVKAIITNTKDPNMSQKVDQELIDDLMTIREKNLNRRMFAGGGVVAPPTAGLLNQDFHGDPLVGMDLSQVKGDQRPFLPTVSEYGKSMVRGAATGSIDTFNALEDLGRKHGFIPDNSAYIPKEVSDRSGQTIRNYVPDYKAKYATDKEKSLFEMIGSFFGA